MPHDAVVVPLPASVLAARFRRSGWPVWAILAWEAGRRLRRAEALVARCHELRSRSARTISAADYQSTLAALSRAVFERRTERTTIKALAYSAWALTVCE